jgi:hypothetical protein
MALTAVTAFIAGSAVSAAVSSTSAFATQLPLARCPLSSAVATTRRYHGLRCCIFRSSWNFVPPTRASVLHLPPTALQGCCCFRLPAPGNLLSVLLCACVYSYILTEWALRVLSPLGRVEKWKVAVSCICHGVFAKWQYSTAQGAHDATHRSAANSLQCTKNETFLCSGFTATVSAIPTGG